MSAAYPVAPAWGEPLDLLGLPVHPVDEHAVHRYISRVIEANEKALILNVNIHCCNLAWQTPWLQNFLRGAQMVFCDGDGVRWGLRILGMKPPPKITYDRWIWQLSGYAAQKGYTYYFLGSQPGMADAAARMIETKVPGARVVGSHHGYFKKEGEENEKVISEINRLRPDILILGFGMPIQEKWLLENWHRVQAHVFLTGGAVFEYVAGKARRAPAWMIGANLEWLFRFYAEPKRLFKRYIYGNPYFMYRIFCEKIGRQLKK